MESSSGGVDIDDLLLDKPNIISQPEDSETTIWRYTSLAKLLNIVRHYPDNRNGRLVFPRADILEDEYEGTLSEPVKAKIKDLIGLSNEELNKLFIRYYVYALTYFDSTKHDPASGQGSVLITMSRIHHRLYCWQYLDRSQALLSLQDAI